MAHMYLYGRLWQNSAHKKWKRIIGVLTTLKSTLASLIKAIANYKFCINFKKEKYQRILPLDFEPLYEQNLHQGTNQFHFLASQEQFSVNVFEKKKVNQDLAQQFMTKRGNYCQVSIPLLWCDSGHDQINQFQNP